MKNIFQILLFIILMISFSSNVFADTYKNPEVIMGPSSAEPDAVKLDETNYAFESMSRMMTREDNFKAVYYISEYRKGDKSVEENLTNLIAKYNPANAKFIVEYMLRSNSTQLVAVYSINHTQNSIMYQPVVGLTAGTSDDALKTGQELWNKIHDALPMEFANAIDFIHLEQFKAEDSMITLCEIDDKATKYALYVDTKMMFDDNKDEFWKQIIYNTVYYYILRYDQTADSLLSLATTNAESVGQETNAAINKIKKENYSYGKHYYKDDAYINIFYKTWWKGRRSEINLGQVALFPNDFLNTKASKTVYEDMAVSFYYNLHGVKHRNTELIKYKKIDFFDNYDIFKVLKKFFKIKLNLDT